MTVAGSSIRQTSAVKVVTEASALNARVKNFGELENGYIVLSATDVEVGGTLNPDASGNQKFAVTGQTVTGTVGVSTLGTFRAYLVDGTTVMQKCGQVTVAEPSVDPTLTGLTVAGTSILTTGSSKRIDENAALAATIINRSELTNGFIVLSGTNVAVGGTLNPDASGNQKFAVASDNISGTVNAATVGTLHAYLVDGTTVLQKCGDVVIVAPTSEVTSLMAGGTDIVAQGSSKNISDGDLSGTYNAKNMNLLTHPRIVLSTSLNVAVGSQVTGQHGFVAANGNAQAFNLSGIAEGTYRAYLIDASAAGSDNGTVAQVMGTVTHSSGPAEILTAKIGTNDWDVNGETFMGMSRVTGTTANLSNSKVIALIERQTKPEVGEVITTNCKTNISNGTYNLQNTAVNDGGTGWMFAGSADGNNITVETVWQFSAHFEIPD